ncbi:MAG: hypothetical protein ACOY46_17345 [Bacillota bacterium]
MADELTKAYINLFTVLRNLEDLCELDEESRLLVRDKNVSVQFIVKDGPRALVVFRDGKCTVQSGKGKCDIKLYFKSPGHLNNMFDGKANPIPLKGFTRLGFLKNEFTKLTDRLVYYLKPTEELLKNPGYFKINTYLTLYTAIFALAEIANHDRKGKVCASRIPDGIVSVSVLNGGPSININVKSGLLEAAKGPGQSPRSYMIFSSLDVANGILSGRIDTYSAIGAGDLQVKGFIPMLDNINKILALVPSYLS